tara:strand:+ start:533 stop:724 length:192 start_codon:yes stop_codon:yes gene_type:complete
MIVGSLAAWAAVFLLLVFGVGRTKGFAWSRFGIAVVMLPCIAGFYWIMEKFSYFMLLPIRELF